MMVETRGESRNVRIARLLGYTARGYPVLQQVPKYATTDYELRTPDGKSVKFGLRTEAEAWQHVPDFVGSCDASLAVLPEDDFDHSFYRNGNGISATLYFDNAADDGEEYPALQFTGSGKDHASALAAALEAYLLAQERPDAT